MSVPRHSSIRGLITNSIQAVVLAGGKGVRLRTIVGDRPKPMASVGEKPFLELQIRHLRQHGISRFLFCVGYLHQHIQDYFGDGRRWGVTIEYSIEDEPLGTGGALKHAERYLQGTFLVVNGDSYMDVDVQALIRFHEEKNNMDRRYLGTLVLTKVQDVSDFGAVTMDQNNRIVSFDEKSDWDISNQVSGGVYVLQPAFLAHLPASVEVSLERQTIPGILNAGFHLFGYPAQGFFADIGTPHGYRRFQEYFKELRL